MPCDYSGATAACFVTCLMLHVKHVAHIASTALLIAMKALLLDTMPTAHQCSSASFTSRLMPRNAEQSEVECHKQQCAVVGSMVLKQC